VTVRGVTLPVVGQTVADGPAVALIRPEAVTVAEPGTWEAGPLAGTVIAVTFLGATSRVSVDLGDVTVLAQMATADAAALSAGDRVTLALRPDPVLVSAGPPAAQE
jgi:putative spermidine/putrescine transport system ATP-binding protein